MSIRSVSRLLLGVFACSFSVSGLAASYDRAEWLPKWSDPDRDCQDTRHELLVRYSLSPVTFTRSSHCKVDTGLWLDPYTGGFFLKASDLDVEHIVPLKWAHDHGGASWTRKQKQGFAEDSENLWLVDDGRNQSKGHRGPDKWMPPYMPVKQIYLKRFMAIVEKYGLQLSDEEVRHYQSLMVDG
ncbi:HNH endonuclease family protein [Microbulbifer sp. OS29]|uniref:HNH endonuclease family protein n=1 Tax=Microbulbifer okhotskensis TaxID=2926617 RepID=A0A9X2EJD1_9GAMM|nr:DUF1524 domain-containing protein [Microbulbifer okhotskensis]MCO1333317.1 HNH endonuclease family protein [Microbulbifer okhotskensis]